MNKFIKEVNSELKNVTWPTKKHAIRISKITVWFTLACAVMLWAADYILSEGYDFVSKLNPKNIPQAYDMSQTWAHTWTWAIDFEIESISTSTWEEVAAEAVYTWELVLPE